MHVKPQKIIKGPCHKISNMKILKLLTSDCHHRQVKIFNIVQFGFDTKL